MIVLEDAGDDEVAVHASFFPQLEDVGGEVLVTPAQAAALELLEAMTAPDEDDERLCHGLTSSHPAYGGQSEAR